MENWDTDNGFGGEFSSSDNPKSGSGSGGRFVPGGWHWLMTIVCLVTVTALSFLMALLTKDIINRPSWMIGAIFTVPTFGMFVAALLVEKKTSAMTPDTSRKAQFLVALIAIVSTFAVGCVCDLIYQHGTMDLVIKNWAETHPPEKVYSDIVLMVDKSSSLSEGGRDSANQKAIREWIDSMEDQARVGLIVFSGRVHQEVPINSLTVNRQKIESAIQLPVQGYTDFDVSLYHAFRMIEAAESSRVSERATQIIAITDAEAELPQEVMEGYTRLAKEKNTVFSIVHLAQDVPGSNPLMMLANSTGGTGTNIGVSGLSEYFEGIQNAVEPDWNQYYHDLKISGAVDFDLIRVSDPEANLICGIMLGLEGLAIGFCLMLLFSVVGQKRIQPLISTVMACAAFVLLKIIGPGVGPVDGAPKIDFPQWILEGIAFSLLGVVFMARNRKKNASAGTSVKTGPSSDQFDDF